MGTGKWASAQPHPSSTAPGEHSDYRSVWGANSSTNQWLFESPKDCGIEEEQCVCALKWQCRSDFCPTQITSLIDGLEIGLKGLVPPAFLLPGWHQDRAPFTGISVIIPPGDGGEEPVRGWAGRDGSNQSTSQPGEVQFICLTHTHQHLLNRDLIILLTKTRHYAGFPSIRGMTSNTATSLLVPQCQLSLLHTDIDLALWRPLLPSHLEQAANALVLHEQVLLLLLSMQAWLSATLSD